MPVVRGPPGGHNLVLPEPLYGRTTGPVGPGPAGPPAPRGGGGGRPMSADSHHIPLAKCRVLYLGSAVPMETANGIEALQQPLRERYPLGSGQRDVPGIDVRLTAYSSGLQMEYVDDESATVWFPIQSLHVCAGVKCTVSGGGTTERVRFVPIDSAEAENSRHPPMFACIMRRTKGVKVLECHIFIAKSKAAAMALVQSCTHAYEHKELWREDAPPTEQFRSGEAHLVAADPSPPAPDAPPEFYEQPPPQGYYYSSSKDLVRNFNVHGSGGGGGSGGQRAPSVQGRPLPARPPPPPHMMMTGPPMLVPAPPPPPPMMMPMRPPPQPRMLPVAPAGYFADWEMSYGGPPVAVFPGGPYSPDEYEASRRRRHRSPKRSRHRNRRPVRPMSPPRPRHLSPVGRRMSPPPVMVDHYQRHLSPSPARHLSPSPARHQRRAYSDGYSNSESSGSIERRQDVYYSGRARTPPADYEAYYGRMKSGHHHERPSANFPTAYDRKDDLVLYAPRYMREMPMREMPTRGREPDYAPEAYYPPPAARDNSRRYPRHERQFEESIREERRAVGDMDNYQDAYREDVSPVDMDMFQSGPMSYDDMERRNGYWP